MKITIEGRDRKVAIEISDDLTGTEFLRECTFLMKALSYMEQTVEEAILELAEEIDNETVQ